MKIVNRKRIVVSKKWLYTGVCFIFLLFISFIGVQFKNREQQTVESIQSTTKPEEVTTLTTQKLRERYLNYLKEEIIPEYGLARLEVISLKCRWNENTIDLEEYFPEDRKGILSAAFQDLDLDGIEEFIVICADTFQILTGMDHYDYDGIQFFVFTFENNEIIPVKIPSYLSEYPDMLSYACDSVFEVFFKESNGNSYLVVYKKGRELLEESVSSLKIILLQKKKDQIECIKYLEIKDGYVIERKEISGQEEVDIILHYDYRNEESMPDYREEEDLVTGDYESIYEVLYKQMEEYNLNVSVFQQYLSEVYYDEEKDLADFDESNMENTPYPSLEASQFSSLPIVKIDQRCENDVSQYIVIEDQTKIRSLLGMEYSPYSKTRPYRRIEGQEITN